MSDKQKKKKPLIRWMPNMKKVLYALIPASIASVYFFGWRSLVIIAVANISAFLAEYIFLKFTYKEPVSSAVFVTGTLLALTLPPTIPIWMVVVGAVFGIVFGKMAFGGFGRNVFNPALVGRAFLYISFGVHMTAKWSSPAGFGGAGGLVKWATDAHTGATTLGNISASGGVESMPSFFEQGRVMVEETAREIPSFFDSLIGNITGSLGETSALLILIGGIYLLVTKTANYKLVLGSFIGFLVMQTILWLAGIPQAGDPITAILVGGFMLGAFFMVTDPISASSTDLGKWINGLFVGVMTVLIRVFANWPEGFMFAILLANMFTPIMDYFVKEAKKKKKQAKKEAAT